MTIQGDPLSEFIDAMASAGVRTADPITGDGKLRRFHVDGDRPGTKNGWVTFFADHPASGAFGSYRLGVHETWTIEKPAGMSDEDREKLRARMADTRRQRAEEQAEAHRLCREAATAIVAALEPASPEHPYLVRKGLVVTPGLKQLARDVKYIVADAERPNRTARKGVLVIPIKGPDGTLHGVQTIDAEGRKHFLSGTNKAGHYFSIGKLSQRIIIAEGFSTSSTIHSATGCCVVIAFDAGNLKAVAKAIHAKYPAHEIVMGADNDRFTMKPVPNPGMTKACEAAAEVNGLVAWPEFEPGVTLANGDLPTDFNDLAEIRGNLESVTAAFDAAMRPQDIENHVDPRREPAKQTADTAAPADKIMPALAAVRPDFDLTIPPTLASDIKNIGFDRASDVDIAYAMRNGLARQFGSLIYSESKFWIFSRTHWRVLPDVEIKRAIHALDGAEITAPSRTPKEVALSSGAVKGIMNILADSVSDDGFFDAPTPGIPARNCLITFDKDGTVTTIPHALEHRRRFVIDADFETLVSPDEPPTNSLLARLFAGSFKGDHDASDKVKLLGEMLGAAASGMATTLAKPKALILYGATAENGKSSVAELFAALLPSKAVSSISPRDMADKTCVVGLIGAAVNVVEELGGAALSGETFKAVVTGNPVTGRDVYKSVATFRPSALHVLTTNSLPPFKGGFDRGLQRRVAVMKFSRAIPASEMVPQIASQIGQRELKNLLGFAVSGAARLIRQGYYTEPASSKECLADWIKVDPFMEWVSEHLSPADQAPSGGWPRANKDIRTAYRGWMLEAGYFEKDIPAPHLFTDKLKIVPGFKDLKRSNTGSRVEGLVLH